MIVEGIVCQLVGHLCHDRDGIYLHNVGLVVKFYYKNERSYKAIILLRLE